MGKKRVMLPAEEIDLSTVKCEAEVIDDPEPGTILLDEDAKPEDRVELALKCLPDYDPVNSWNGDLRQFRYWKIRNYAYAYRSKLVTPSMVAERIITIIEEFSHKKPPAPLLVSFDAEEVRKQAAASTKRFEEGKALSILDGIFMAIKDDIGCHPYVMKEQQGTLMPWKGTLVDLPPDQQQLLLLEFVLPHSGQMVEKSSAILCSSLCESGTVEIIGPIASAVEDVTLVYAAILGSYPMDRNILKPWFNDVHSTDISDKCEDILNQLSKTHGCEAVEIVIPELHEMSTAHLVSIGSKMVTALNPDCEDGKGTELNYGSRTNMALFRSFTASDYVAAQ
ncbi:hypothetical protein NL676_015883 [Syzygium grande]|nr:hypothetical protein NL676_015883 [Syzygium grande]